MKYSIPKFHLAHVSTRLDTAKMHGLDTRRDEPSGIWSYDAVLSQLLPALELSRAKILCLIR